MKIKITNTIESEIDISVPAYRKTICHFVKITKEHMITVCNLEENESISRRSVSYWPFGNESKESNEKEFKKAFDKVSKILLEYK